MKNRSLLFIDPDLVRLQTFTDYLPKQVKVISAPSIRRALQHYQATDMVVISGGEEVSVLTTFSTIIRPRYSGRMIAGHIDPAVNRALMASGCDDMASDVIDLAIMVKRLLANSRTTQHHPRSA